MALPPLRTHWRSRYGPGSRIGWAVLAVVVLAGLYELLGLLFPGLPGAVGVSPRPSVTAPSATPTLPGTASARPGAPSPVPGPISPSTTRGPTVVVIQPQRGDRGPQGPPGPTGPGRDDPSPAASPSRAASPSPGPSPTRACTVTVQGRCVVPGLSP